MKRNRKLVASILLISSIAAIIMASVITAIGIFYTREAYYDSFAEELHAAALMIEDEISHEWKGNWSVSEENRLMKGSYDIYDSYLMQLDDLHESTGIHFTIFYGDTRYLTSMVDSQTGLRMEGTKASEEV
nr:cache domain-containing protein [Lachnospiraceae bacterium]